MVSLPKVVTLKCLLWFNAVLFPELFFSVAEAMALEKVFPPLSDALRRLIISSFIDSILAPLSGWKFSTEVVVVTAAWSWLVTLKILANGLFQYLMKPGGKSLHIAALLKSIPNLVQDQLAPPMLSISLIDKLSLCIHDQLNTKQLKHLRPLPSQNDNTSI